MFVQDGVSRAELERMAPDTTRLESLETSGRVKGVIVTARSEEPAYHFLSRYFAPWNGIPEDPVTGSAHTVLAPYWAEVVGSTSLVARQCSARGGELHLSLLPPDRVQIAGEAVLVITGNIDIGTG